MAQIDVSELLLDPDFVSTIQYIRRTSVLDSHGRNTVTESSPVSTQASVQPASHKHIQRLPETLRVADVRAFYVKIQIFPDNSSGEYPTILVYKSKRYEVQYVDPWEDYGDGWCLAVAVGEKPS